MTEIFSHQLAPNRWRFYRDADHPELMAAERPAVHEAASGLLELNDHDADQLGIFARTIGLSYRDAVRSVVILQDAYSDSADESPSGPGT